MWSPLLFSSFLLNYWSSLDFLSLPLWELWWKSLAFLCKIPTKKLYYFLESSIFLVAFKRVSCFYSIHFSFVRKMPLTEASALICQRQCQKHFCRGHMNSERRILRVSCESVVAILPPKDECEVDISTIIVNNWQIIAIRS